MHSKKLLNLIALLALSVFLLNFSGNQFYWYYTIWYFDIIVHFLGGFWTGLLAVYLFHLDVTGRSALKVLGFVLLIGISWELFEIFSDKLVSADYFNLSDTLADLIFDFLGGAAALFYYRKIIMLPAENNVQSS